MLGCLVVPSLPVLYGCFLEAMEQRQNAGPKRNKKSGDVIRLCYDETDVSQPELLLEWWMGN